MTKLFVGGLPYSVTSDELKDIFAPFGAILSATVVNDKFTGRSRGFGFVEMDSDEEAQKAIQNLNESEVSGRKIVVSVAKPREERPSQGGFRRDNYQGGYNGDRFNDKRGR